MRQIETTNPDSTDIKIHFAGSDDSEIVPSMNDDRPETVYVVESIQVDDKLDEINSDLPEYDSVHRHNVEFFAEQFDCVTRYRVLDGQRIEKTRIHYEKGSKVTEHVDIDKFF